MQFSRTFDKRSNRLETSSSAKKGLVQPPCAAIVWKFEDYTGMHARILRENNVNNCDFDDSRGSDFEFWEIWTPDIVKICGFST